MNKFRITRTYKFEMSHALFMHNVSPETNRFCYGNAVNPHGHNWRVDITVEGTKDVRSHMIYDLNKLDKLAGVEIDYRWDHKYFDVTNLDTVPTLENITKIMFNSLRAKDTNIASVSLYEEPDIYATYGGGPNMYVTHVYKFNAQHRTYNPDLAEGLNDQYYGKCRRFHGHSYELSVTLKGKPSDAGLVINHARFDKAIYKLIKDHLDYKQLNDLPGLEKANATTENVLEVLWPAIKTSLLNHEALHTEDTTSLYRLRLKETDRNVFDYFGPDTEDML